MAAKHLRITESNLGLEAIESYLLRLEMEATSPKLTEEPIGNLRHLVKPSAIPRQPRGPRNPRR